MVPPPHPLLLTPLNLPRDHALPFSLLVEYFDINSWILGAILKTFSV